MEEFLSAKLLEKVEERLGLLGRPLTTLAMLVAVLGVIAWGGDQIVQKAVQPIVALVSRLVVGDYSPNAYIIVGQYVGIIVLAAITLRVSGYLLKRQIRSKQESLARHIESHMQEDNCEHQMIAMRQEYESQLAELRQRLEAKDDAAD